MILTRIFRIDTLPKMHLCRHAALPGKEEGREKEGGAKHAACLFHSADSNLTVGSRRRELALIIVYTPQIGKEFAGASLVSPARSATVSSNPTVLRRKGEDLPGKCYDEMINNRKEGRLEKGKDSHSGR